MHYLLTPELDQANLSCLIIGVHEDQILSSTAQQLDNLTQGYISRALKQNNFSGKINKSLAFYQVPNIQAHWLLIIGCGKNNEVAPFQFHQIIQHAYNAAAQCGATSALISLAEIPVTSFNNLQKIRQAILSIENTAYQFNQLKTKSKALPPSLTEVYFYTPETATQAQLAQETIKQAQAIAAGIKLTKDLANLPANICTPTYLAEQGNQLAQQMPGLVTHVVDENDMALLGMNTLLSVSKGSSEPAKLIVCHYKGATDPNAAPYALVGKGITFDSGGISLKPAGGMDEMKFDMAGAASVLGTLRAIAELKLPINVIGVIAAAENLPGNTATRPGDIVTSMNGLTVEILNTDAEGRLVLCDALTYVQQFKPKTIIDVATLTGAMIIALGHHISGLMSNNDTLAQDLVNAGEEISDSIWRFPLSAEYQSALDSNFADMANVSNDRAAGSIIAASFLARFVNDCPWAHLDIAGTAWKSGKEKGATGRPVALLTQYLLNESKKTIQQSGVPTEI